MSDAHFEITRDDGTIIVNENIINLAFFRKHILTQTPGINITDRRTWFWQTNFSWWVCDIPLRDGENLVTVATKQENARYEVGTFYFTNSGKRYIRVNVQIKDVDKDKLSLDNLIVYIFGSKNIPSSNNGLEMYDSAGNIVFSSTYSPARIIDSFVFDNVTEEENVYNVPSGKMYSFGSPLAGEADNYIPDEEWSEYGYLMAFVGKHEITAFTNLWSYQTDRGGPDYFFPMIVCSYGYIIDVTNL